MSIQAIAWVLRQVVGESTAKLVLMALANYAGEDGENAFPSVKRLMRDTELSERAVRAKLDWLTEKGFIRLGDQSIAAAYAKRKDRTTVCYDLILRGAPDAPREDTGCTSVTDGVHVVQERGAPPAPNPSSDPSFNKSATAPAGHKAGPREEIGYTSKGTVPVAEVLAAREREPVGRKRTFDAEFKARFGVTPQEAQSRRERQK